MARDTHMKGTSIVEMLVFMAIAVSLFLMVVEFIIMYGRIYSVLTVSEHINSSAMAALERMTREIKGATSVDQGQSVFGVHPGTLVLNSENASGTPMTIEFYVSSSTLMMKRDGVPIGALTRSDVSVDTLLFSYHSNLRSALVTVEMTARSGTASTTRSASFFGSGVLRGAY